jgi:hypothetical protein
VYTFAGSQPNTVVNAKWCDNVGVVAVPIQFDRTNLNLLDSAHTYVYSGNSGTCLAENPTFVRTLTVRPFGGLMAQAVPDDTLVYPESSGHTGTRAYMWTDNYYDIVNNYHNGFSGQIPFFRIGTDSFVVGIEWFLTDHMAATIASFDDFLWPMPFAMRADFVEGFGWKLNLRGAPNYQDSNRTSSIPVGWTLRGMVGEGFTFVGKFTAKPNP